MVYLTKYRTWLIVVGLAALVGCGPNWEELAKAQEREGQNLEKFYQLLLEARQPADSNLSSEGEVGQNIKDILFMVLSDRYKPDSYQETLNYVARYEDRQFQYVSLGSSWLQFGISEWRRAARNYGNRITIDASRRAKNKGEGFASASGDTEIGDLYFAIDHAQGAWESSNMAQGKDSQFQSGAGIQGQVFSDPPNFQQTEEQINLDSSFGASVTP